MVSFGISAHGRLRKIIAHSTFELYFETIKGRVRKATLLKSIRSWWKVFSVNGIQVKTYFQAQEFCLKFCQINPMFGIFFIATQF